MSNNENSICNEIPDYLELKEAIMKNLVAEKLFENILDSYEKFRKYYQLVFNL